MKIIVAVDDSPHSERALQFVTRMHWPPGSRMLVASAAPIVESPGDRNSCEGGDLEKQRCHRERVIVRAQNQLRDAGFSTERRGAEGDVCDRLFELVDHERADLLVMGARGPRGASFMPASVSGHAVAHASCPVLIVKAARSNERTRERNARMNVLIGVDDSAHSRAGVEFVRRMAWPNGSRSIIVSVARSPVPAGSAIHSLAAVEDWKSINRMHEDIASIAKDTLASANLTAETRVLRGDPGTLLLETAHDENVDLIVVGSHGHTGLATWAIGSVASHVVAHARCSVLVVKLERP